ncbi:MAG: hypothetical protein RLZZ167_712 [Pseudomonadota bacterium]|jgi:recombinational DNA repair protein RecT
MTKELTPIDNIKNTLLTKLPQFITGDANKYINSVLLEIAKSKSDPKKDLSTCSPTSILQAVKQAVDLGLEIDGRKHGHLIKRNVNVGTKEKPRWVAECQFQVGYPGFIYSLKREVPDANIVVNLVKDGDLFTVKKYGDIEEYTHTVKDAFAGQDKIVGGYCYLSFTLGDRKIAKVETMSKNEIDKIKSCAITDIIWNKWYEEKAKIAILRRACKVIFAGLSSERINKLLEHDNRDYNLNQEVKQEPKIINDLPKVDFDDDSEDEIVYTPEQLKEIEEAEKERKAEEFKRNKEGE